MIYIWGQDATRFGARISHKTPTQKRIRTEEEDALVQEILDQLVLIHGDVVRQEYLNKYFAFDWNGNPLSMGAYALFGPGEFSTLYHPMIKAEVNGTMHFAGEATSVNHGWILGALNSAYRTVMDILMKENMQSKLEELKNIWGEINELNYFV